MRARFADFRPITAKYASIGTCGHPIAKGDLIGFAPKAKETCCRPCLTRWQGENAARPPGAEFEFCAQAGPDAQAKQFPIVYPERRYVSAAWILSHASDTLANAYMEAHPDTDWDAPEHAQALDANSRVSGLLDAIELLDSEGLVTFQRPTRELAEAYEDAAQAARVAARQRGSAERGL